MQVAVRPASVSRGAEVTDLSRADAPEVLSILLPRISPSRTSQHGKLSAWCQADSICGTDVHIWKYAVAGALRHLRRKQLEPLCVLASVGFF